MANLHPPSFSPLRYYFEANNAILILIWWVGGEENIIEKLGSERNNASSFSPQSLSCIIATILSDTASKNILRKKAHMPPQRTSTAKSKFTAQSLPPSSSDRL